MWVGAFVNTGRTKPSKPQKFPWILNPKHVGSHSESFSRRKNKENLIQQFCFNTERPRKNFLKRILILFSIQRNFLQDKSFKAPIVVKSCVVLLKIAFYV